MAEKNAVITWMCEDEIKTPGNLKLTESGIDFFARMFAPLLMGDKETE